MAAPSDSNALPRRSPQSPQREFFSPSTFDSSRPGHVEGAVPPELSPLDAFALQGRLLAKHLERSEQNGRRASRLPPLMIANTLAAARPVFSTSPARDGTVLGPRRMFFDDDDADDDDDDDDRQPQVHVQVPDARPKSCHPRVSDVPSGDFDGDSSSQVPPPRAPSREPPTNEVKTPDVEDRYSIPRTMSPDAISSETREDRARWSGSGTYTQPSSLDLPKGSSTDSVSAPMRAAASLTPPRPPFARGISSIRSVPSDSPEDDRPGLLEASWSSVPRKLSSGSAFSTSTPPRSPFLPPPPPPRSPSVNSERSIGGVRSIRALTNFSRPISRAGRPSVEAPSRENSSDSHGAPYGDDNNVPTPVSMTSEEYFDASEHAPGPAPAYVYSRFSLPRGRMVRRDPRASHDDAPEPQPQPQPQPPRLQLDLPLRQDSTLSIVPPARSQQRPPSPPSPLCVEVARPEHEPDQPKEPEHQPDRAKEPERQLDRPKEPERARSRSLDARGPDIEKPAATSSNNNINNNNNNISDLRTQPQALGRPSMPTAASFSVPPNPTHHHHHHHHQQQDQTTMAATAAMVAAVQPRDISAEEHLTKGIDCHERGSLNESTYHLRIAAKAKHPTAMLLYALACRHGWGMRPNPREGVQWLRKAADLVGLEVADEESRKGFAGPAGSGGAPSGPAGPAGSGGSGGAGGPAGSGGPGRDVLEMKTRRAQFALSIYELGVSHMNGWGIEQDKALALRCFEIAGSWGDCDALSEAGFCYAQGIGCKKDLKKSAKFYRMAESKGMSMVGNSWIHKSKYKDDDDGGDAAGAAAAAADRQGRSADRDGREKKVGERSRARSIFSRKKSTA